MSRLGFHFYNRDLFSSFEVSRYFYLLYGGLRFDLTAILYLNLLYILAILLPFRFTFKKTYIKTANYYFVIINSLALALNSFDTVYYRFTLKRTTLSFFKEFQNESHFTLFFKNLFEFWEVTIFFIVLVWVFLFLNKRVQIRATSNFNTFFYLKEGLLLLGFLYFSVIGIRGGFGKYTRPIAPNTAGQYVQKNKDMALVLNTPFTLLRTSRQKAFSRTKYFSEKEVSKIFSPIKKISPNKKTIKNNVIILVIESFGREHSGKLNPTLENGNYLGYTPFLDSLMGESLYFTNAYANGKKSIDALPSIFAGLPAFGTHFFTSHYSTNDVEGIGTFLKEKGYDNAFFHGAPNGSMGFNSFMNMAGFPKYYGMTEFGDDKKFDGTWGIWDYDFLQFMANKIDDLNEPFCASFFSLSSHSPFDLPENYNNPIENPEVPLLKCVKYTDYALEEFFKTAQKKEWFENTVFIITADHAAHPYHKEYTNSLNVFAVPLIFYTPDASLKGEISRVAQQVDIFPTLVDYLGYETEVFSFGSNLFAEKSKSYAVNFIHKNYQLVTDSLLYILGKNGENSLYNYKKDVFLENNILKNNDIYEDSLLKSVIQEFNNRMIDNKLKSK
jgi:phosphoglycerol transferase MdoB-like AlkP superfamily enzyme